MCAPCDVSGLTIFITIYIYYISIVMSVVCAYNAFDLLRESDFGAGNDVMFHFPFVHVGKPMEASMVHYLKKFPEQMISYRCLKLVYQTHIKYSS